MSPLFLTCHSRANGNPDYVPARAGNHHFRDWFHRIKCGACSAFIGMTRRIRRGGNLSDLNDLALNLFSDM